MKEYSKAVSEMYSQFKKEAHPLEKYVGRLARCCGEQVEVVGYAEWYRGSYSLIVDGTKIKSWSWRLLAIQDVIFKNCECYNYVDIEDLID